MRIEHFHFLCEDPELARNFFVRHFGAVALETVEMPDWRILRLRVGDTVLAFSPKRGEVALATRPEGQVRGFDHIGITVDDVDGLVERLRSDGVEVVREPFDVNPKVRVAYVMVPDHIQVELLQPRT